MALLGLVTALLLASFVTDVVKNTVGRPRPDLLARCKARPGTSSHELVDWHVCTETNHHTLHDGFRSFPSGHSSFSWAGLGYLSLFLAGQLHALRRSRGLACAVVAALPAIGAALITISRTQDYRHDVFDVIAGTAIGAACAWFCYRRYFRHVAHRASETPYRRGDDQEADYYSVAGGEEGDAGEDGDGEGEERFERLYDVEMGAVGRGPLRS